jgi:hypothetical protein
MSDLVQMVALAVAAFSIAQAGYMCGRRAKANKAPEELMEIRPLPYVAFLPGTRQADRIAFLENMLKATKAEGSVEVAGLKDEA